MTIEEELEDLTADIEDIIEEFEERRNLTITKKDLKFVFNNLTD